MEIGVSRWQYVFVYTISQLLTSDSRNDKSYSVLAYKNLDQFLNEIEKSQAKFLVAKSCLSVGTWNPRFQYICIYIVHIHF